MSYQVKKSIEFKNRFNIWFILFTNTPPQEKLFALETWIDRYYLVLNFYQINGGNEIRTLDHLITKILISY